MLRRIRELQAAGPAVGHVTGQHVISKVILRRFAEPWGRDRALLSCPFRLGYPGARHRPAGADGCGKAGNFVGWSSASAGALWKETEDRLPDALAAMDAGTLLARAEHAAVIKPAIALHFARSKAAHFARSKAAWLVHARVWAETVAQGRKRWLTEQRELLAYWLYQEKGLCSAGDEALGIFADELTEFSLTLAGSGALWRERVESLYMNARAMTGPAGLEIITPPDGGEFLIGDVPALTVRAGHPRAGVLGGLALADAQPVFLPLGPGHVAALERANSAISLTPEQVAETNARQLAGALEYVYLRPGSPLTDTVRLFARQRKSASETAA
jgi:hypothetical protein